MLQKLRVLHIPRAAGFRFAQQGAKGIAVVLYASPWQRRHAVKRQR